ncbi:MAG: Rne/Rng family ribonuclease [Phycisphaerales bacterium]
MADEATEHTPEVPLEPAPAARREEESEHEREHAHEHAHDAAAPHHEEHTTEDDVAAFASYEAVVGAEEDAPILPVRPIDDDVEEDEDDDAEEESAEESTEEVAAETAEAVAEEEDAEEAEDAEAGAEGEAGAGGKRKRRRRGGRGRKKETQQAAPSSKRRQMMIVNDVPGEECRIAVLEDGRLEQIFAERVATATNVGNIYKGRVVNVEPAIQAAFIDFGEGANGFLHISDLHPRYFPGTDRTEQVGRKIPRRDRPPIQEALRRGQEVIVQVLKEGIGTKGPTLTSYISIPGRLLVMMPHMDKVGVSRKVDDEDQRREMRRILDSLDLPEGAGFILRTAGFDRTRTELQRDAMYLQRLWEAMEKRMASTGAPCTLYTESDLLVRTIRDVADDSIEAIVVDNESAYGRARTFLQVVAPLNAPKLLYYDRQAPIFHAFNVEQQIEQIHSRTVPLPSGGALVIDQTEAMVAIDVNSGKSRSARDSETNAFNTNKEAVEEIARQLRLRDLGGIIVNDLIDMRSSKHRREIEERFEEALRRDRAKTTTLEISDFGMIEMTRQRMRPGLHKTNFMDCPHCHGSGEVRVPDAVAADALRRVALLFCHERAQRVEVVCSVRVASVLLSGRRNALYELEERTGKRVDVRISETFPIDRVDMYAYDERGADIEVERLPRVHAPRLADLLTEPPVTDDDEGDEEVSEGGGRRRRRRRKPAPADATAMALAGRFDDLPTPTADEPKVSELIRRADAERQARKAAEAAARAAEAAARAMNAAAHAAEAAAAGDEFDGSDDDADEALTETERAERAEREATEAADGVDGGRRRRRRRRGRGKGGAAGETAGARTGAGGSGDATGETAAAGAAGEGTTGAGGEPRKRRRRRRGRGGAGAGEAGTAGAEAPAGARAASGESDDDSGSDDAEGGAEGSESGGEQRAGGEDGGEGRGRRRRGRRGGRGRKKRTGDGGGDFGGGRGDGAGRGEGGGRSEVGARSDGAGRGESSSSGEGGGDRAPRAESSGGESAAPSRSATSKPLGAPDPGRDAGAPKVAKAIRSVTGWMRRLKGPVGGADDDR